jgi:hypothetical protein
MDKRIREQYIFLPCTPNKKIRIDKEYEFLQCTPHTPFSPIDESDVCSPINESDVCSPINESDVFSPHVPRILINKLETKTESESESETKTETKTESESESESETKIESELESETKTESESETKTKTETKNNDDNDKTITLNSSIHFLLKNIKGSKYISHEKCNVIFKHINTVVFNMKTNNLLIKHLQIYKNRILNGICKYMIKNKNVINEDIFKFILYDNFEEISYNLIMQLAFILYDKYNNDKVPTLLNYLKIYEHFGLLNNDNLTYKSILHKYKILEISTLQIIDYDLYL